MHFIAGKEALLKELTLVQGIVERRNTIPVLANVLIEAGDSMVDLAATDLDVGLRCRLSATVKEPGALTLSAKKLFEIAREVSEAEIEVKELENSWASIKSGKSYFKMVGLAKAEFPALPEAPEGRGAILSSKALKEIIRKTSFAITADDSRYFLNGARLELEGEEMRMVATDGHRLAFMSTKRKADVGPPVKVIVPKKTLNELTKILSEPSSDGESNSDGESSPDVAFAEAENHLFFRLGKRLLVSKKVDDQFPAYEKVIPQGNDKIVVCGREDLLRAVRRACLFANERSRAVRLSVEPGTLEVSSQNPEIGEAKDTVEVDYSGDGLQVGFNGQYVMDFLNVAGADKIRIELKNDSSQGLMRPADLGEGTDYRYVVMPMRL